jgi:NTE family protein
VLRGLARVSSVSGGSITAGMLGLRWRHLGWSDQGGRTVATNLTSEVIRPIMALAEHTLDVPSAAGGFLPGVRVDQLIARAYRKHLFGDATLQDLPSDEEGPRFVINATNVQSGVLWRFSRPYMGDYQVGRVVDPTLSLAVAVTASSAFPPVLSPARLDLPPGLVTRWPKREGEPAGESLHREPYTTRILLTDGGVYDNLGLEPVWKSFKTVLVSDGGGQMEPEPAPAQGWARHSLRVNGLIDSQVRSLRKRQVVGSLAAGDRQGAYWRTRSDIRNFPARDTLPCPVERTRALAEISTRLCKLDRVTRERLVNWGYAIADAGVRGWLYRDLPAPDGFPFAESAV